jgi:hypothetical protein
MRWLKRDIWKAGIAITGMLLLLMLITWVPVSAASMYEGTSGSSTPGTATMQATPTEDATVTALNKEKLAQEVQQLKDQNNPDLFGWLRTNASILLSTLVVVVGALIGFFRWLEDRRAEQEKQAEERFQKVVEGFGSDNEGAKAGAAILLRTFLRPDYKQFYTQTYDLAVAHLRLRKVETSSQFPVSLDSFSQALITVWKESFPLTRDWIKKRQGPKKFDPQVLDAASICLHSAYLARADLAEAWIVEASLQSANLTEANLSRANLFGVIFTRAILTKADLSGADLTSAHLSGAILSGANLSRANLSGADLSGAFLRGAFLFGENLTSANLTSANLSRANLSGANLFGADLSGAHPENANSLKDTNLCEVKGLTKEQLATCKTKGAIIDEDSATSPPQSTVSPSPLLQSKDALTPSAPSAQESTSDTSGNGAASSEPDWQS